MLKIKDEIPLKELEKFGFQLNENNTYEYKELYPLEADGTRYVDDNDFDYIWSITIYKRIRPEEEFYELYIEIINNDCSYHNEGDEVEGIGDKLYDLIQAGLVEKVEE